MSYCLGSQICQRQRGRNRSKKHKLTRTYIATSWRWICTFLNTSILAYNCVRNMHASLLGEACVTRYLPRCVFSRIRVGALHNRRNDRCGAAHNPTSCVRTYRSLGQPYLACPSRTPELDTQCVQRSSECQRAVNFLFDAL